MQSTRGWRAHSFEENPRSEAEFQRASCPLLDNLVTLSAFSKSLNKAGGYDHPMNGWAYMGWWVRDCMTQRLGRPLHATLMNL